MTGLANSGIKETKEALAYAVEEIKELQDALDSIADAFKIGEDARTPQTILANVLNAARRSACLSRIERHHVYTFEIDGEEYTDSMLNWGESPDDYIETYKAMLRRESG